MNVPLCNNINIILIFDNQNIFVDSTALSCAKLMWEMGSKNPVKVIKGIFSKMFILLRGFLC